MFRNLGLIGLLFFISFAIYKKNISKSKSKSKSELLTQSLNNPQVFALENNPVNLAISVNKKLKPLKKAKEQKIIFKVLPPTKLSKQQKRSASFNKVEFQVKDGWAVSHGDIVWGKVSGKKKNGYLNASKIKAWENGIVPYSIDAKLSKKQIKIITSAVEYISSNSNVEFIPNDGSFTEGIVFTTLKNPRECRSYLGRAGDIIQPVFLGSKCGFSEILHELMHVLGFVHEHSRIDRDQYVKINWDNIVEDRESQFYVYPEDLPLDYARENYDFKSIMHYGKGFFSKNKRATIEPLDNPMQGLGGKDMSEQDWQKIDAVYY